MAGLSRKLNLSERDINLKEALQKLYSPGIEEDVELFSLSSQITSLANSGTERQEKPVAQIITLETQLFKPNTTSPALKRTRFGTKDYTFATGNKVYFDTYTLGVGGNVDVVAPVYSVNGSIAQIQVKSSGDGFFFRKNSSLGEVRNLTTDVVVEGVVLRGRISGAQNALATINFVIDSTSYSTANVSSYVLNGTSYAAGQPANDIYGSGHDFQLNANGSWNYTADSDSNALNTDVNIRVNFANNVFKEYTLVSIAQSISNQSGTLILPPTNAPAELSEYTGFYTRRFKIGSITLTSRGTGYILGENLDVLEGVVINSSDNTSLYLEKQADYLYSGKNPSLVTTNYLYDVVKGGPDGFYLYDSLLQKYLFLDKEKDKTQLNESVENREIRLERFDGVNVKNIFNLRFSSSSVGINSYSDRFRVGGKIVDNINNLQSLAARLTKDAELSIQNTRLPLTTTDERNDLGFEFNRFVGVGGRMRQRLILRDQDFILSPNNDWITEAKLKTAFESGRRFEVIYEGLKKRIPGLFIKVGAEYKRAFSTRDKPFFTSIGSTITNPDLGGTNAVSAADTKSGVTYAFNTELGILAQRIQPVDLGTTHDAGEDGAFYFHKNTPPTVTSTSLSSQRDGAADVTVYSVPLFRYLP